MKRTLITVTATLLLTGIVVGTYPFIAALKPDAAAVHHAGIKRIDVGAIPEGEARRYEVYGLSIIVLHRTPQQLQQLSEITEYRLNPQLTTKVPDPEGIDPQLRSFRPEYFVVYGWTGNAIQCGSHYRSHINITPYANGFQEECRGSWHDVTGRLLRWSWAEGGDLPIPPHHFVDDTTIEFNIDNEHYLHMWRQER